MNKLVNITAATILALTAGMAFAKEHSDEPKEGDYDGRPAYCHALKVYIKRYDSRLETAYFEYLERLYKARCQKEDGEGEGHEGRGE